MNVKTIVTSLKTVISNNAPTILTGAAVGGVITTVALAITATPKALQIREFYKESVADLEDWVDETAIKEARKDATVKFALDTAKIYAPTVISGTMTIACIVGAHTVSANRMAALAALYSASEKALEEFQKKAKNVVGNSKVEKIKDELISEKLKEKPVGKEYIINTGEGDTLCYDVYSGRYFTHDIEKIRKAINDFNQALLYEQAMSLNEFYGMLGLQHIRLGDNIGWTVDKMLDPNFRSGLTSDMTPCLVLDYQVEPTWDYRVY